MNHVSFVAFHVITLISDKCAADWIEIPQLKPDSLTHKNILKGNTRNGATANPALLFRNEVPEIFIPENAAVTKIEYFGKGAPDRNGTTPKRNFNIITIRPNKTSVKEVFSLPAPQVTPTPLERRISQTAYLPEKPKNVNKPKRNKNNNNNNNSNNNKVTGTKPRIEKNNINNNVINTSNFFTEFLPFIKTVQSTLLKNAHNTIKSKVDILRNIKDNLLYDIDRRIKALWFKTDQTEPRDWKESGMEFPSNEGALMTIGFLTLAVFLVKLVLKVIYVIKAKKTYYYNSTTGSGTTLFGRKKRDIHPDIDTTYRILTFIDTYNTEL